MVVWIMKSSGVITIGAWRLIDSEAKNTMVKEHILEP